MTEPIWFHICSRAMKPPHFGSCIHVLLFFQLSTHAASIGRKPSRSRQTALHCVTVGTLVKSIARFNTATSACSPPAVQVVCKPPFSGNGWTWGLHGYAASPKMAILLGRISFQNHWSCTIGKVFQSFSTVFPLPRTKIRSSPNFDPNSKVLRQVTPIP